MRRSSSWPGQNIVRARVNQGTRIVFSLANYLLKIEIVYLRRRRVHPSTPVAYLYRTVSWSRGLFQKYKIIGRQPTSQKLTFASMYLGVCMLSWEISTSVVVLSLGIRQLTNYQNSVVTKSGDQGKGTFTSPHILLLVCAAGQCQATEEWHYLQ